MNITFLVSLRTSTNTELLIRFPASRSAMTNCMFNISHGSLGFWISVSNLNFYPVCLVLSEMSQRLIHGIPYQSCHLATRLCFSIAGIHPSPWSHCPASIITPDSWIQIDLQWRRQGNWTPFLWSEGDITPNALIGLIPLNPMEADFHTSPPC